MFQCRHAQGMYDLFLRTEPCVGGQHRRVGCAEGIYDLFVHTEACVSGQHRRVGGG